MGVYTDVSKAAAEHKKAEAQMKIAYTLERLAVALEAALTGKERDS